jgi:hypothetical protein
MGKELLDQTISTPLLEREVCKVSKKKCTGREFKMIIEIGGYDMDGFMLDMGSNVNIISKKSWEFKGKPINV